MVKVGALLVRAKHYWLSPYALGAVATILLSFLMIAVITRRGRRGWRDLLTRDVAADACWTIFYLGGFYTFFIGAPIYKVVSLLVGRFAPWMRISLLAGINPYLHFLLLWLAIDFTGY